MSDAFRSAIDPTGCNAERVDLKNTDARMGLKTDFDNKGLLSASVISNEEDGIVFSDVDVSSNEDDSSNNDEFFDASEGQGMSRISFKKSAAAFVETVKPAQKSVHPARSVILHKMSGISIRVLLPSFDMAITDSGSHSLKIVLADLTVAVFVPVPSDPMISLPPTNLALKINKISIVEVFIDPDIPVEIPFVYFNEFTNSEDKDVFPYSKSDRSTEASSTEAISLTDNAALELRVEFSNRGRDPEVSSRQVVSDLSISINLNPVVFVICPDSIIRWIAEFQPVMTSNDDERSSSFSIILIVPCVNVILCPVTTPASGLCEPKSLDILHALGIINKDDGSIRQLQYSRWMKRELTVLENARTSLTCINRCVRNNGNIPFLKSPSDKYFRINMLGVRFRLQTENRTKIPANQWYIPIPIIELNEIGAYMRLETDFGAKVMPKTAAFELKFITSFSSRERKISVRKFVESDFSQDSLCEHSKLPAILKSRMSRKEFSRHQNAPTEGNLPGISSKTGPVPPPLHGGEIFVIDAHLIRLGKMYDISAIELLLRHFYIDLQQKEYSFFIGLIDLFVPISNVSSKSDSFGASKIGDSNYVADIVLPKGIGIKLTAEIFLCSLAQDEFIQSNSSISEQNIVKENRNTYVLSTREPLIEFYQSYIPKKSANFSNTFESHIFVGLEVENVSAFELTDDQMKIPHCASGISAIGVRIGPESYNIPIIHVTTFARDWMSPAEDKNPTCTSQETVSGDEIITKDSRNWTLSIGALITEDKELNTRNTVLNLDFQNVTVRYDPLSRSLLNFINVVTPLTLKELLPLYNRENNSVKLLIPKVLQPPAETLHLRVTVHQALLDYCAVVRPSKNYDGSISHPGTLFGAIGPVSAPRILVSLRKMVIGTTIVSTSHQFGLKIGANDVSLRLTNSILRDPRFELIPLDINGILSTQSLSSQQQARGRDYWPCCRFFEDFIDVHAFVRMGKIRKFDLMLRLNGGVKLARSGEEIDDDSDKIDASATIDDIFCCGCADSLNVLAVSLLEIRLLLLTHFLHFYHTGRYQYFSG